MLYLFGAPGVYVRVASGFSFYVLVLCGFCELVAIVGLLVIDFMGCNWSFFVSGVSWVVVVICMCAELRFGLAGGCMRCLGCGGG